MALDDLDRLELSITPLAHHTRATSRGRCAAHDADAPRGRGNPPRPRPPYMDQPLGEGVPPMMQTQPRESATAASVLHRSRASGRLPVTDTHACKAIGMGKGATAASGGDWEGPGAATEATRCGWFQSWRREIHGILDASIAGGSAEHWETVVDRAWQGGDEHG